MPCRLVRLALIAQCLTCVLSGADLPLGHEDFYPSPERPVGWRGDGSGSFPGARPVERFSIGSPVEKEIEIIGKRGRERAKRWMVSDDTSVNIAWRTRMPGWSNGGVIIVGAKAFCLAEPHTLVCVDMHTGEILWQRENNPFELLGMGKDKAATYQQVFDAARLIRVLSNRVNVDRRGKGRDLPEPVELLKMVQPFAQKLEDRVKKLEPAAVPPFSGLRLDIEARLEGRKAGKIKGGSFFRDLGIPYAQTWLGMVGWTHTTPVSDGKQVYASMGQGQVVCYDLEGRRRWAKCIKPGDRAPRVEHVPGPLLADGILVAQMRENLHAFDAATGKELWTHPTTVGKGYNCGAHKAVTLDSGTVVVTTQGKIIDLANGKELGEVGYAMAGGEGGGSSLIGVGEVLVFMTKPAIVAVALERSGDKVTTRELWKAEDGNGCITRIIHDGRLYDQDEGRIIDLTSGQVVGSFPGRLPGYPYMSGLIAGEVFFRGNAAPFAIRERPDGKVYVPFPTLRVKGNGLEVINVGNVLGSEDKPPYPAIERTLPDLYDKLAWGRYGIPSHFGYAQPFAQGNRVLIRSLSTLYCIGDPKVKYNGGG